MTVDIYVDDFIFPPYIFQVQNYGWEIDYYGFERGYQLHILWWVIEITINNTKKG